MSRSCVRIGAAVASVVVALGACSSTEHATKEDAGGGDAGAAAPFDAGLDADAQPRGYVELPVQHGVFAVVKVASLSTPYEAENGTLRALLSRPYVRGLSLSFAWADLEPTPGTYASVVRDVLAAVRTVRDQLGKPLTVKIHLRNGLVPDWLVPASVTGDGGTAPFVFQTSLGFRALGIFSDARPKKVDVTLIPTETAYAARVAANITEVANQLDAADPQHDLVQIVQIAGPSSESGGTIRLSPREGFPRDGREDGYGFHWTFPRHLEAWRAMGPLFASLPAYRARAWTFDLTHEPPIPGNDGVFGLSTAEQMSVVDALATSHPGGAAGIRLMREGIAAQSNRPDFPADRKACTWAVDYFLDAEDLPDRAIAAWPRHEYQDQTAGDDANNFPRFELARIALFGDPAATEPSVLQHTQFLELHDSQILADGDPLRDDAGATAWFGCLDVMLRKYAAADTTLSAVDRSFWAAHPSESLEACTGPYATTPPSSSCAP